MNEFNKGNGIYKVNLLIQDNKISKIIVFYGLEYHSSLNDLFKKDPMNEKFIDKITQKPIFSKEEIENIQSKKISVLFSDQVIHFDDSISTIKLKIWNEFKHSFPLEEIYLFALKEELLNTIKIYQLLANTTYSQEVIKSMEIQKEKIMLTMEKLDEFLKELLEINNIETMKITSENKKLLLDYVEKNIQSNELSKNKLEKYINLLFKNNDYDNDNYINIPKKTYYDFIQIVPKKKNKILLTRVKLEQFLLNIIRNSDGEQVILNLPKKEFYDYNDLLNLNLNDKKFWVAISLGRSKIIYNNEYPYIINPFDLSIAKEGDFKSNISPVNNISNNLLLDSGYIINNNIYLCLAKDVLKNAIYEENIIKLYYPFLYNKKIYSLEELETKNELLKEENTKLWNDTIGHAFKSINLFYNMFQMKKSNLNYKMTGIKYIKFLMKPDYQLKIPLEIIFKIIHATEDYPLIKFNPSSKQENIFRLYSNKFSTDGRKIPFLSKVTIFKLIKTIGKTKSVSIYIENKDNENLVIDLYENGEIVVYGEFQHIIELREIDEILQNAINPIILEIKNYLLESGYKINSFHSLLNNDIEVQNIHYQSQIEISKEINLNNIKGCVNNIFVIEEDSPKKPIQMRFKRVSNFNKRNSQEAFIIEKQRENYSNEEIITGLMQNYNDIKEEDAKDMLRKIINESQIVKGIKREISEIKINPGFKTIISLNKFTSIITINVENINNILYLSTIPIYIDSLIRLTQLNKVTEENNTTSIPLSSIKKLCSSKATSKEEPLLEKIFPLSKEVPIAELEEEKEKNDLEKDIGENEKDLEEINFSEELNNDKAQKALDLFFMNSDDEEEEEEEEEEQYGGNTQSSDIESSNEDNDEEDKNIEEPINEVKNIDGMNINNPYYFQERIQQRDPNLILTKPYANYSAYSRVCPSTTKRQPVILNQEELDKINKEHKGFLKDEDIIKYGSEKGKEFYYICPRYWCLKNNTVIDPNEMEEVIDEKGNKVLQHPTCGRILPKGEKKVKPGYYIYEFYTPPKGKEDTFKKYPGFQQDSHPQGFCLPCCFNNWKTPDRVNSRNKCMKKEDDKNELYDKENEEIAEEADDKEKDQEIDNKEEDKEIDIDENLNIKRIVNSDKKKTKSKQVQVIETDDYIKGPDKFPLEEGRWGVLPIPIQQFLNEPSSSHCQINKTTQGDIKSCLLRHGVEISEKQSFIACIADAIFYARKDPNGKMYNVPSIKQMKEILISAISLDKFITYQNGNLVTNFYKLTEVKPNFSLLKEKYGKTKLFSKLDLNEKKSNSNNNNNSDDNINTNYFFNVVNAFENFISYLKDDDVIINFTYLWDIICKPNNVLFNSGINLVILRITNNDITNNVELICPTNHYTTEFFETRKPTLILINEGNLFEPIYSYKNDIKKKIIGKVFSEYDPNLSPTLRGVFKKLIKPYLQNMCVPLSSMPNIYKAKKPLLLLHLIQILYKHKYTVINQVVNYNSQVIGVIAENIKKNRGFIPCFPSSINETYSYTFMIDDKLWNTYDNTISFLNQVKSKSHNEIPCKPAFRIVEEEHIVGIITETNQFIPTTPPLPLSEDTNEFNLPILQNNSYLIKDKKNKVILTDNIISTSNEVDEERVEYIKKIKLESSFYNVFRNTIRILINDYTYISLREKIEEEIMKPYVIYSEKLKSIDVLLKKLVGKKIEFTGDVNYYKKIEEVNTCIINEEDTCNKNICIFSNKNGCTLVLPELNLVTNKKNENMYFGRMADELIRFNRIQNFMFKPQTYLSFNNIGYNLKENEILIIQSLLTPEYFENLVPALINQFVHYNSYDQAEPIQSLTYDNDVNLNNIENDTSENTCKTELLTKIKSSNWQKCFPSNFKEKEYSRSVNCTYQFIIDLIKSWNKVELGINQIKTELYNEYKNLLPLFKEKILDILIIEGKKILGDQVKSNTISFSSFIYSDVYFLTNLDMWILINKFKIPCFFISNKYLLETNYNRNIFLGYGERSDTFAFIVTPGFRVETIPSYKIILSDKEDIFITLDNLPNQECVNSLQEAINNSFTIEDYLNKFVKASKTLYHKKKPKNNLEKKLIIEEDNIPQPTNLIINKNENENIFISTNKLTKTGRIRIKKITGKNTTRKNKEEL